MAFEFQIERVYSYDAYDIYYFDSASRYSGVIEDGEVVIKPIEKEVGKFDPLLRVPGQVWRSGFLEPLLQALVDKGVRLPEKAFVEGKLEATELHLKDLQNLVFKNK